MPKPLLKVVGRQDKTAVKLHGKWQKISFTHFWLAFQVFLGAGREQPQMSFLLHDVPYWLNSHGISEALQLCVCVCVNHRVVSHSSWPHELWPARLLCPWNSPGKNTRSGCHSCSSKIKCLNFMAAITIHSDFGAPKIKSVTASTSPLLFSMKW